MLRSSIVLLRSCIREHYRKAVLLNSRTSVTPPNPNAKYPLLVARSAHNIAAWI